MNIVQKFPSFFSAQEDSLADEPITSRETESVLKGFARSKSYGPNGRSIELFLEFFDIMGQDNLDVVEESWSTCKVYDGLNSTCIALIPKVNKHVHLRILDLYYCVI